MKIDYVVGNPPYQKHTSGKSCGTAIWTEFIDMAKSLDPKGIVMITPSRWFTGGQGVDKQWRQNWLNDYHIERVKHYENASEIFNDTEIAGGVSYFIWIKNSSNNGENNQAKNIIRYSSRGKENIRQLNEFDVFIPDITTCRIFEKVVNYTKIHKLNSFETIMGSRREFEGITDMLSKGIDEYKNNRDHREFEDDIEVICSQGIRFFDRASKFKGNINSYRVLVSYCTDSCSINSTYSVLSEVFVTKPGQIHSQGYLHITCQDENAANNIERFMKTKFARFILRTQAVGIHISIHMYSVLPLLDLSKAYNDQELYKLFDLNSDEINCIENTIRPFK